ncbi:hypothetical protein BGW39_006676 [Mortierella sp. 14UC]|nr:hypothetical protein BGW39_006676 [Mortierella sp. 14UC]
MAFPSLLSEHEQKAFSAFLGQLAEEERSKAHNQPGHDYQQHQNHLQLNPILSSQLGPSSPTRVRPMPSDPLLSMSQQQQQQHEWAQQAGANRLLAPGSMLDPQAMSQAFLQNPELMAQASAISQAMALAQQQQQQQQQMQLQIQAQEQMAHQQHNSNPNLHLHETRSQDLHPQPHQYQQHPTSELYPSFQQQHQQQQHQQHQQRDTQASFHNSYPDPNMPMGIDSSFEAGSGPARTVKKRKSQTSLHGGHTSRSSGTPPLPSNAGAMHYSTSSSYVSTSPTGYYESEQVAYFEQGENSTPPSKKPARRKESSGNDYPYATSSPHHRAGQRSSHDGHDSGHSAGSGVAARRKMSEPSYVVSGRHSRDGSEEMAHGGEYTNYHPHSHHDNGYYSNGMSVNYGASQIVEGDEAMMSKRSNSNNNRHPYSDDQEDLSRALSPQQNNSLNQMQPRGPGKKQPHELLTDAEKKANHIASEQKRRQNIRIGFDSLVEIVPTLGECQRSEALILQKSVDYIQRLLDQKSELKSRVRDLQVNLGENADGDESASEMEFEE